MTDKHEPKKYILYSANWRTSVVHTVTSIVTPLAWIGLGVWLESEAMQWLGAIGIIVMGLVWAHRGTPLPLTISQARAELDKAEAAES